MIKVSAIAFAAMIGLVGAAQAQSGPPLDPNGRPYIGYRDWHPGPGDYNYGREGNASPTYGQQATAPMDEGAHAFAFKDEYGFRYDAQGNRIDRLGRVISPQDPNPNR
jgi:hypothetical protein